MMAVLSWGLPGLLFAGFVGLVGALHLVVQGFPGVRQRYLFCRRPCWVVRFLAGELSVLATLFQGVPVAGFIAWWLCAMGLSPGTPWLFGALSGWCGLLAVVLVNAGRNSRLEGGRSLLLALLAAILLLLTVVGVVAGVVGLSACPITNTNVPG